MKTITTSLIGLVLLGAAGFAQAAGNCTVTLKGDDSMKYDLKTATVSASCPAITIELQHTGKMPVGAMGHNVVITASKDMDGVVRDSLKAGAANGYLPKGDARILAATATIGGGQKAKTTLPGKKLTAGGDYTFFCSFPGHSTLMKGKLVVVK